MGFPACANQIYEAFCANTCVVAAKQLTELTPIIVTSGLFANCLSTAGLPNMESSWVDPSSGCRLGPEREGAPRSARVLGQPDFWLAVRLVSGTDFWLRQALDPADTRTVGPEHEQNRPNLLERLCCRRARQAQGSVEGAGATLRSCVMARIVALWSRQSLSPHAVDIGGWAIKSKCFSLSAWQINVWNLSFRECFRQRVDTLKHLNTAS